MTVSGSSPRERSGWAIRDVRDYCRHGSPGCGDGSGMRGDVGCGGGARSGVDDLPDGWRIAAKLPFSPPECAVVSAVHEGHNEPVSGFVGGGAAADDDRRVGVTRFLGEERLRCRRPGDVNPLSGFRSDAADSVVLPPYSPELNPDEWVWKNIKHDHAGKMAARTVDEFREGISKAASRLLSFPEIILGFFADPDLAYIGARPAEARVQ